VLTQEGRLTLELPLGRRKGVVAVAVELWGRANLRWSTLKEDVVVGLECLEFIRRDEAPILQKRAGGPQRRQVCWRAKGQHGVNPQAALAEGEVDDGPGCVREGRGGTAHPDGLLVKGIERG
jgi:hypothetical protein